MTSRDTAVRLLTHYFALLANKSGVRWDRDTASEIADAVDAIIAAARETPARTSEPHQVTEGPSALAWYRQYQRQEAQIAAIYAELWDPDAGDWRELSSCADAIEAITRILGEPLA